MNIDQVLSLARQLGIEVCIHNTTLQFLNRAGPSTVMMNSQKTHDWYGSAWSAEEDVVHYVSGPYAIVAEWCLRAAAYGPAKPVSSELRHSTRKPGV